MASTDLEDRSRTVRAPDQLLDVVVVGAGFAGLYAIVRLRRSGFSVQAFEAGGDVGGTWYWNRYPGCRCDVESVDYSYSFSEELQQEWTWRERYASQPDILRYLNHVADRFDLRRSIAFDTSVTRLIWNDAECVWQVETDRAGKVRARFVLLATGALSATLLPDIPGRDAFAGLSLHTSRWPHAGVDFRDKRVGVIGTGSSGIQAIPQIARDAHRLVVFQRTPNFSIPVSNPQLRPEDSREVKATYAERRRISRVSRTGYPEPVDVVGTFDVSEDERQRAYEKAWTAGGVLFNRVFNDQLIDERANELAAEFVRNKIRSIVRDPVTATKLTPTDHPIGSKRICTDSGYYATFNRANVELVDIREDPIQEIDRDGLRTRFGYYQLDILVFATGFDAISGAIQRIDIIGTRRQQLRDAWASGAASYLGVGVAGFPNLFTVNGPGSPSVLVNMVLGAEQQVDWISDCLDHVVAKGARRIEVEPEAQATWFQRVQDAAEKTLLIRSNSWQRGANVAGKPNVFMPFIGGLGLYTSICDEVAGENYRGFRVDPRS